VGSGIVGKSYAMMFAGAGYNVSMYDIVPEKVTAALSDVKEQMKLFERDGYLRGKDTAEQQMERIAGSFTLRECVEGAVYLQECVPEILEIKKTLFKELDDIVDDRIILASSASAITASEFSEGLRHRSQCVVAHPVNPPYFVPLVEIVPAPWTRPEVVAFTRSILEEIGQAPVTLSSEVPGFSLNRIQYVVLNECWRQVEDGLISVKDVNTVMSEGLGMRWAFMGALETSSLNGEGFKSYCERYGPSIVRVSALLGGTPSWEPDSDGAELIHQQMRQVYALDQIQQRREWRDKRLAALDKLKRAS